ncbi:lysylphosphatidylglycerol synthase transmembrane domain-containing protein [Flavobacterium sp. J27]|uniref:lysylphosphatidylglycerol synthase transmembrane domain-containing protein n=1 Tax=Flavobacterium sp. J27 TaxID=2060419 RepID=UPI0013EE5C52|nr:lysylphosphatidylglycerol synthase transmembrane domain-containing protein [Flavobacterium sp. J27]
MLKTVIPLLIGIALIYYQFSSFTETELKRIKDYFREANYFYVFLSIFISLFGYWSRAYRWKYSLNHLGYQPKFYNSFFAVSISYLLNLTIPRSGEISRAVILKNYEGVPFDKGFGTIVAERVVDLLIFLLFVITAFLIQFEKINTFIFSHISPHKIALLFGIALAGMILFLFLWRWSKWSFILKIKSKFNGLVEGMTSILKMKTKWKYLAHSFFIWFSYLMMFYVCVFSIPETASISFDIVIMGFIFGTLAVGFTNGGIGAFPISIAKVLLLYGIAEDAGTALGWIIWTSQTILTIVLGLISYLLLNLFNKN